MMAQPGGAAGCLVGPRADPDWRMGLLYRLGMQRHRLDLVELAREGDLFVGPQPPDKLDAFGQARRALGTRKFEGCELLGTIALSDAEVETPVGEDIDAGGVFGDANWVMKR